MISYYREQLEEARLRKRGGRLISLEWDSPLAARTAEPERKVRNTSAGLLLAGFGPHQ